MAKRKKTSDPHARSPKAAKRKKTSDPHARSPKAPAAETAAAGAASSTTQMLDYHERLEAAEEEKLYITPEAGYLRGKFDGKGFVHTRRELKRMGYDHWEIETLMTRGELKVWDGEKD